MGAAYWGFGQALAVVAVVGAVLSLERFGVGRRAMDWAAPLVTALALMTTAASVAITFLADRFTEHEALQPVSGDLGAAITWTTASLLVGGSGLLCAVVGAVFWGSDWGRRWAGGCLAVSCLGVLALLPIPAVLIWEAAMAAPVGG